MRIGEMRPHSPSFIPEPSWRASVHATGTPIINRNILVSEVRIDDGTSITAFDIETGRERWRNSEADGTKNGPAFLRFSGHILLSNPGKGVLYGIDSSNGRSLWQLRITEEPAYVPEFHHEEKYALHCRKKKAVRLFR